MFERLQKLFSGGSLKSALLCSGVESFFVQLIVFCVGIVIARLIGPRCYGIWGILMVFIMISEGFIDAGLGAALIHFHDEKNDEKDSVTIFWINLVFSLICYFVLFVFAGKIARFNNTPEIQPLLQTLGLLLIINAMGLVQKSLLRKQLNMLPITVANIVSYIFGGGIGILCAWKGLGTWSLVFYKLTKITLEVTLLYCGSSWRPRFAFYRERLKVLFGFGIKITFQSFIINLFRNVNTIIIGKNFNMTSVGYYTRAFSIANMPQVFFQGITGRVCLPCFALLQHAPDDAAKRLEDFILSLCSISFFCQGCLWILAKPLVLLLLTDKWLETVPLIEIFCYFLWLYPVCLVSNDLLNGLGDASAVTVLTIFQQCITVGIACVCIFFSLTVFAWGAGCAIAANAGCSIYFVMRRVPLNWRRILKVLGIRFVWMALFCAGCRFFLGHVRWNIWMQIFVVLAVMMLSVIVYLRLFDRTSLNWLRVRLFNPEK